MVSSVPLIMSITVSTRRRAFSFTSNTPCKHGACRNHNPDAHRVNGGRNMDTCSTSASPVEVFVSGAGTRRARLANIGVIGPLFWFNKLPPLGALATTKTTNDPVAKAGMPRDDIVDWFSIGFWHNIGWSAQRLATIAKESVDFGHHCCPQQVTQRPVLCCGLHLSLVNPQTRPEGGAMWSASCSSPSRGMPCAAC